MINQQKFPAKQVPQSITFNNKNAWCVGRKQVPIYYFDLSFCVHKQTGFLRSFLFHHAKLLAVFVKANI